jgi:fumarate reductase subunit C
MTATGLQACNTAPRNMLRSFQAINYISICFYLIYSFAQKQKSRSLRCGFFCFLNQNLQCFLQLLALFRHLGRHTAGQFTKQTLVIFHFLLPQRAIDLGQLLERRF